MSELKNLRIERQELTNKIRDLEADERSVSNEKYIGKFFKYKNCYSCPKTDDDYWWLYTRVGHIDNEGKLFSVQFQCDKDGKIEVENRKMYSLSLSSNDYIEITAKEYDDAWAEVSKKMFKML